MVPVSRVEEPSVEEAVERLDDVAVRRLLVTAAEAHEDVGRAVRLAAAGDGERLSVLRAEVDRGLRPRRHLGYRESSAWAREAAPVVDALTEAVATEPSPQAGRAVGAPPRAPREGDPAGR